MSRLQSKTYTHLLAVGVYALVAERKEEVGRNEKISTVVFAFLVVVGLLLMPAVSGADPDNGNGNGNAGGNGNHYGWDNRNDTDNGNSSARQIPEPLTLLLLGSGLVGLAGVRKFRK